MRLQGVLLAGVVACACSTTSTSAPPASDAGAEDSAPDLPADDAGDGGTTDAPVDAPRDAPVACTSIALLGSLVPGTFMASAPPAATGGAIADGTYVLTGYRIYTGAGGLTGPTGQSIRTTMRLAGGAYESVSTSSVDPSEARVSGTYVASNTSFAYLLQCPVQSNGSETYTSDGATLVQQSSVGANTIEMTFTKQ
jgi:hypothetical protein